MDSKRETPETISIGPGESIIIRVEQEYGEPVTYTISTPNFGQDDDLGGSLMVTVKEGEGIEVSRLGDAFGESGNDADGFTLAPGEPLLFGSTENF